MNEKKEDLVISNVVRSQVIEDYLYFFENKDIESIEGIFSEDCTLTDWNVGIVEGKQEVMQVFQNIFSNADDIVTDITHIHEDIGGILTCEMKLEVDGEKMIVADIFEFDNDDKIKRLRAYKGN